MTPDERVLGVADAMALAKGVLETVRVRVVGEVTCTADKPGYKAVYFSLKDDRAVMPCLMWRDAYDSAGVALADGQLVEASGFFTAYPAKGRLQFQVRSFTLAGEGALRMQVAELARRLELEGLMDAARKRALPRFPVRVGLVTSPRGKAVHDVLRTLARRYPTAELVVAGVPVEGENAVAEIVRGLEAVAREPGIDVILLVRGGGSYEDLMPFNAEAVARAIVACPVPVVTGIGHEPDTSIADMVADVRASTPTAAAEAVSPDRDEVMHRLDGLGALLGSALTGRITQARHRMGLAAARPVWHDASVLLGARMQGVDLLASAIERALPERIVRQRETVARLRADILRAGHAIGSAERVSCDQTTERVRQAGRALIGSTTQVVSGAAARLHDLSPLGILGRGYAVCYEQDGVVVRDTAQVTPGDHVRVRLARGHIGCIVEDTEAEE